MDAQRTTSGRATLYRMVMPDHLCPFGLKAKALLERRGFEVDDRWLTSRQETDDFQARHDVDATPQVFIDGERIGGYDELREHFGLAPAGGGDGPTYRPVAAVFGLAAALALATGWVALGNLWELRVLEWFVAFAMALLGLQKLRDLESFSNTFLGYDLLAQRWIPYAYAYPWAETGAGVLMIAGVATWLAAPVAILIGAVGAVSVFKAVYVDKRELRCACVGGDSQVPLGAISLTENLMMLVMGGWMLARVIAP